MKRQNSSSCHCRHQLLHHIVDGNWPRDQPPPTRLTGSLAYPTRSRRGKRQYLPANPAPCTIKFRHSYYPIQPVHARAIRLAVKPSLHNEASATAIFRFRSACCLEQQDRIDRRSTTHCGTSSKRDEHGRDKQHV